MNPSTLSLQKSPLPVFRRKDKVWVWIAMNRETREIVASACGDRTENTCRILCGRIPSAYKEAIVFSDYWSAYRAVIPSEQQRPVGKETGETAHIERWNNTLWEQLAGVVNIDNHLIQQYFSHIVGLKICRIV